jgi:DNA-directed RNA polymerase subunit E'/Rpb7
MQSTRTITRRVCVEASSLTSDIRKYIFDKLEKETKNECTVENGYFIRIKKIVDIKDSYISNANSDIIFSIDFEAETIKPEVGSVFEGVVWKIFEKGLFVIVEDRLRILVALPALEKEGYKLENNARGFGGGGGGVADVPFYLRRAAAAPTAEIRVGSKLSVIIRGVKFNKGFTCYADLKV